MIKEVESSDVVVDSIRVILEGYSIDNILD